MNRPFLLLLPQKYQSNAYALTIFFTGIQPAAGMLL